MIIERNITGRNNLEDILLSILNGQIDKIILNSYDEDRANAVPSDTEGVAE
ncbi:hypothetical protein [Brevibacillus marinus]|uniref:hypothetical protein n=1 Tax=Brevibacillus marinus TaxID=2496837 RepID=UPI0013DEEC1C|nr:hypothetical protein [Brevibacillus marinus]